MSAASGPGDVSINVAAEQEDGGLIGGEPVSSPGERMGRSNKLIMTIYAVCLLVTAIVVIVTVRNGGKPSPHDGGTGSAGGGSSQSIVFPSVPGAAPPRPLLMGHRGVPTERPENTLSSFRLALERLADGFELDVMQTADGLDAITHDDNLANLTNGTGTVHGSSRAYLDTLNAAARFVPGYGTDKSPPAGSVATWPHERIPTLAECLSLSGPAASGTPPPLVNVEIKVHGYESPSLAAFVSHVVSVVKSAGAAERVVITSFEAEALEAARVEAPTIRTGIIVRNWEGPGGGKERLAGNAWDVIVVKESSMDASVVGDASRAGKAVWVWTVRDESSAERQINYGVAGIIAEPLGAVQRAFYRLSGGIN